MHVSHIAARYSKALFTLVLEYNALEEAQKDMVLVSQVCMSNREFRRMLKSPVINTDKKINILKSIFELSVSKLVLTFLLLITHKKREKYIHEIALEFGELYKDHKGIITTQLITAAPVDDEIRRKLTGLMKEYTGATIELKESVDEELVGGFILKWKDKQYDASIESQLNDLMAEVARINLYKKRL